MSSDGKREAFISRIIFESSRSYFAVKAGEAVYCLLAPLTFWSGFRNASQGGRSFVPQPVAKDNLCSLSRAALRNCSKIFQETKYEGITYPAVLGGVLPSWYLTLAGCGYVSGTGCVTAEPLAASVRVGHCDL